MKNRLLLSSLGAICLLALAAETASAQRGYRGGRGGGWGGGWGGGSRSAWGVGVDLGGVSVGYSQGNPYGYGGYGYGGYGRGYGYGYPGYYGGNYFGLSIGSSPYYYGSGYGYSSPSYGYVDGSYSYPSYASPSYSSSGGIAYDSMGSPIQQASYAPMLSGNQVGLRIAVPNENAQLWIQGQLMPGSGFERTFVSPALETGRTYTYTLRCSWTSNGREVSREKSLDVTPGQEFNVSFTESSGSSSTADAPRPSDANREIRPAAGSSDNPPPVDARERPGVLGNANEITIEGVIVRAADGSLVMTSANGDRRTFSLNNDVRIMLDNRASTLADLREGQRIRVFTRGSGDSATVLRIEGAAASSDRPRDDSDNTRRDEPRKDEPRKDEPRKDEPRKDEPRKDEPRKDVRQ